MIVVSNTGPIIALLKVELLDLLKHYFKEVCLSSATYHELTEKGKSKLGAELIRNSPWIKVKEIQEILAVKVLELELDLGESETIILAQELNADLVLLDESISRNMAQLFGLPVKGSIGILVMAKRDGLIKNLKEVLDRLRQKGVWISDEVYNEALRLVGEK